MKVLILSPFFPPLINGLSHYTKCFAEKLSQKGDDVTIACMAELGKDQEMPIIPLKDCSWFSFCDLFQNLKEGKFDRILIQYVPHMYNRRGGINFSLPLFVIILRLFGFSKIEVMFHELHYPFELKPISIILWFAHHLMLIPILWFSHSCFFSTKRYLNKAKKLTLKNRLFFLPVGSNIPRYEGNEIRQESTQELSIGFFGGPHASKKFFPIFKGMELSSRNFHLHFMGVDELEFSKAYGDSYKLFKCTFHGRLSDSDLSRTISGLNLLCAYFTDGVSARRGSILASLNNGTPVLTTKSRFTEELFFKFPGVILLDGDDTFAKSFALYFDDEGEKKESEAPLILDCFDQYFSWDSIVRNYQEFRT